MSFTVKPLLHHLSASIRGQRMTKTVVSWTSTFLSVANMVFFIQGTAQLFPALFSTSDRVFPQCRGDQLFLIAAYWMQLPCVSLQLDFVRDGCDTFLLGVIVRRKIPSVNKYSWLIVHARSEQSVYMYEIFLSCVLQFMPVNSACEAQKQI